MGIETEPVFAFVSSALAASQVGTWESDRQKSLTFGDSTTARLLGIDPQSMANGVPFGMLMNRIYPADRESVSEKITAVRDHGGLFVIEHRVCPKPTDVRWVLARGRYERSPVTGHVVGRGIIIDITESKLDWQGDVGASFALSSGSEPSMENIAGLILKARDELVELGEQKEAYILPAMNLLLWQIGRALAKQRTEDKGRAN